MNPLKIFDKILSMTPEQSDSLIKFSIAVTFCCTVVIMVGMSLISVVFIEQPMGGMAPADKQFFLILSDMSKYILGSLATLLAVKGKDGVQKLLEPPGGFTKPDCDKPAATPVQPAARQEPSLDPISTPTSAPIATGYGGRAAPVQPPHPEIN
jgi:hypothetical protein